MNAAVLGGLVEQWVWRCQKVATQYQLRQPIDLKAEVEKLVEQAEVQARLLEASGPVVSCHGREQARHQGAYRQAAGAAGAGEADRSGAQRHGPRGGLACVRRRFRRRGHAAQEGGVAVQIGVGRQLFVVVRRRDWCRVRDLTPPTTMQTVVSIDRKKSAIHLVSPGGTGLCAGQQKPARRAVRLVMIY